ncbi:MAG: DinB family protein [Planctomycetota bacterium]|nr:DinB family protein [Planctomycetota bacterium]
MANEQLVARLQAARAFFENTIACFEPEDGSFAPQEGMFTVAQHIAHTAHTIEWFLEGAFRPQGMDLDFAAQEKDVRAIEELEDALAWWNSANDQALEAVAGSAPESWSEPIRGELMGGMPRESVIGGIVDHNAHHRGALSVYARLAGREPKMPYG